MYVYVEFGPCIAKKHSPCIVSLLDVFFVLRVITAITFVENGAKIVFIEISFSGISY